MTPDIAYTDKDQLHGWLMSVGNIIHILLVIASIDIIAGIIQGRNMLEDVE